MFRITIAVAARGANMATRLTNDSTDNESVQTCQTQVHGTDCPQVHSAKVQRSSSVGTTNRPARKSSRRKHLLLAATLGLLLSPTGGCQIASGIGNSLKHQEALDGFMIGYRNQAWAAKAWLCRKHRFANHCHLSDFEQGFRAGYEQVAKGGDGCAPGLCPKSYWGWQYQNSDGQARMNAWFEGFPLGVQAAEEDGIGHWSRVQTSMPMAQPMSPTMTGSATPTLAPAIGAAGASAALSDQAESVAVPIADPIASPKSKMAKQTAPLEPLKSTMPPPVPKAADVKSMPKPPVPKPTVPAPKLEQVIPQPSADPFGFD